jgi:hypothetical protein
MNERIKELAKQAHFDEDGGHLLAHGVYVTTRLEKFAELIVKECADVLVENGDKQFVIRTVEPELHNKTTDWMQGYEEAVKHYGSFLLKKNARLIKKHFGVEE